jgi:hypothetical protein
MTEEKKTEREHKMAVIDRIAGYIFIAGGFAGITVFPALAPAAPYLFATGAALVGLPTVGFQVSRGLAKSGK